MNGKANCDNDNTVQQVDDGFESLNGNVSSDNDHCNAKRLLKQQEITEQNKVTSNFPGLSLEK